MSMKATVHDAIEQVCRLTAGLDDEDYAEFLDLLISELVDERQRVLWKGTEEDGFKNDG